MTSSVFRSVLPFSPAQVQRWHLAPGTLLRLLPPWQGLRVLEAAVPADGSRAVLRLAPGITWVARHRILPDGFVDSAERGPFRHWRHQHRFVPAEMGHCLLEDHISWRAPLDQIPWLRRSIERELQRVFAFRHQRTQQDLARLSHLRKPLCVAVSGASGLVGRALCALLCSGGHRVRRLQRGQVQGDNISWDPVRGPDPHDLQACDAVVHLAGAGIADGRWTQARKKILYDSRVLPSADLARACRQAGVPVLIQASAVGYYGNCAEPVDEASPAGQGFLPGLCQAWEAAVHPQAGSLRVVQLRLGAVLSSEGGLLGKVLPIFRLGLGGPLASGQQWMSWIHRDDAVAAIVEALTNSRWQGVYNLVAPEPCTNAAFTQALAKACARPAFLPAPGIALRLAFGEMAEGMLLSNSRVRPVRLQALGFVWRFPELDQALGWERGSWPSGEEGLSFPR